MPIRIICKECDEVHLLSKMYGQLRGEVDIVCKNCGRMLIPKPKGY